MMVGGLTRQGDLNMAIGSDNSLSSMVGHADNRENLAIGDVTMETTVNGKFNVAIGKQAMRWCGRHASETWSDVFANVAIGLGAMQGYPSGTRTQGSSNVALGYYAMGWMDRTDSGSSVANYNVCIGPNSGYYISAQNNVYIGVQAGQGVSTGSTGHSNVGIGKTSLYDIEDGYNNVCIGLESGQNITSGLGNVCIGQGSGEDITTGDSNICIGYDADATAGDNYQIAIGYRLQTDAVSQARIGSISQYVELDFSGSGENWANTSDVRIKKNITDFDLGLEFINKLRPIKYQDKPPSEFPEEWNIDDPRDEASDKIQEGFIAQEVKEATDNMDTTFSAWSEDTVGRQKLQYTKFVLPLVKAVQEMSAKFDILEERINNLEAV